MKVGLASDSHEFFCYCIMLAWILYPKGQFPATFILLQIFLGSPISLKLLRSVVSFIHLQIVHIISLYCCVPTISQLITLEANTSSCYNSSVHVLLVAQLGLTFLFYLIELFIMLQMLHLLGLFAYLFCRFVPTLIIIDYYLQVVKNFVKKF